jgi:hemolysin III
MDVNSTWRSSFYEELANTITHTIGIILAAGGLGVMIVLAAIHGNIWHIISTAVFGTTLILLYTISTLYHSVYQSKTKMILQQLDHSAIFLLIAGTYTPFTLVSLRGPWGWLLFGIVWGLAILGIVLQLLLDKKGRIISILLYLLMGWLVIIAIKPLIAAVDTIGFLLLLFGGLFYTGGLLFYVWFSLPYHHAIWHVFVLVGSGLHYFSILFYVIPLNV